MAIPSACAHAIVDAARRDRDDERRRVLRHFGQYLSWSVVGAQALAILSGCSSHSSRLSRGWMPSCRGRASAAGRRSLSWRAPGNGRRPSGAKPNGSARSRSAPEQIARGLDLAGRPVFVCGVHRSGTTLVRDLLDGHPALAVLPSEGSFYTTHRDHLSAADRSTWRHIMGCEWCRRLANPINQLPYWLTGRGTATYSPSSRSCVLSRPGGRRSIIAVGT